MPGENPSDLRHGSGWTRLPETAVGSLPGISATRRPVALAASGTVKTFEGKGKPQ